MRTALRPPARRGCGPARAQSASRRRCTTYPKYGKQLPGIPRSPEWAPALLLDLRSAPSSGFAGRVRCRENPAPKPALRSLREWRRRFRTRRSRRPRRANSIHTAGRSLRGQSVPALVEYLRVGPLRFHVGEHQDADKQRRDQRQHWNQYWYSFHFPSTGARNVMGMLLVVWSGTVPVTIVKWLTSSRRSPAGSQISNSPCAVRPAATGTGFGSRSRLAPGNCTIEKITAAGFLPRFEME